MQRMGSSLPRLAAFASSSWTIFTPTKVFPVPGGPCGTRRSTGVVAHKVRSASIQCRQDRRRAAIGGGISEASYLQNDRLDDVLSAREVRSRLDESNLARERSADRVDLFPVEGRRRPQGLHRKVPWLTDAHISQALHHCCGCCWGIPFAFRNATTAAVAAGAAGGGGGSGRTDEQGEVVARILRQVRGQPRTGRRAAFEQDALRKIRQPSRLIRPDGGRKQAANSAVPEAARITTCSNKCQVCCAAVVENGCGGEGAPGTEASPGAASAAP